jgi:hypothetical protein
LASFALLRLLEFGLMTLDLSKGEKAEDYLSYRIFRSIQLLQVTELGKKVILQYSRKLTHTN